MKIDERLEELMGDPWLQGRSDAVTEQRKKKIRAALLEVAKDQREACAEALHTVGHDGFLRYEETDQAVRAAEIK